MHRTLQEEIRKYLLLKTEKELITIHLKYADILNRILSKAKSLSMQTASNKIELLANTLHIMCYVCYNLGQNQQAVEYLEKS